MAKREAGGAAAELEDRGGGIVYATPPRLPASPKRERNGRRQSGEGSQKVAKKGNRREKKTAKKAVKERPKKKAKKPNRAFIAVATEKAPSPGGAFFPCSFSLKAGLEKPSPLKSPANINGETDMRSIDFLTVAALDRPVLCRIRSARPRRGAAYHPTDAFVLPPAAEVEALTHPPTQARNPKS